MMDKAECVGGGEDLGEEGMQCSKHPNKSCAGGICGLCLQEKLGKLVSSSKSNSSSFFPISSSSSSASPPTSFTSTTTTTTTTTTTITTTKESSLNRSKSSSATASRRNTRFWSFIHLPVSRRSGRGNKGGGVAIAKPSIHPTPNNSNNNNHNNREEKESPSNSCSALGRKVGRSRSVGCGSRSMSFSGDFLERLSTGFGDCTVLRRVESHREAPKQDYHHHHHHRHPIKDRVKCGGLFGGFGITLTSPHSVSTNNADAHHQQQQQQQQRQHGHGHGRTSKSWGWHFASPIRALIMPSSSSIFKPPPQEDPSSAYLPPSLLSVRS